MNNERMQLGYLDVFNDLNAKNILASEVSGNFGLFNNIDLNNVDILSLSGVNIIISSGSISLTNRPTVNGVGVLLSGEASSASLPNTIVYTTGDQIISGNKIFVNNINISGTGSFNAVKVSSIDKLFLSGIDMVVTGNSSINVYNPIYISGNPVLTGIIPTSQTISNVFYTTGDQIISGNKTFLNNVNISGTGNFNNLKASNIDKLFLSGIDIILTGNSSINVYNPIYISGNPVLTGIIPTSQNIANVVYTTGNQTINGFKTFVAEGNNIIVSGTSDTEGLIKSLNSNLTIEGVNSNYGIRFSDEATYIHGNTEINNNLYVADTIQIGPSDKKVTIASRGSDTTCELPNINGVALVAGLNGINSNDSNYIVSEFGEGVRGALEAQLYNYGQIRTTDGGNIETYSNKIVTFTISHPLATFNGTYARDAGKFDNYTNRNNNTAVAYVQNGFMVLVEQLGYDPKFICNLNELDTNTWYRTADGGSYAYPTNTTVVYENSFVPSGIGGSINTSCGGGSIDTRGKGVIQFGINSTRTTLVGTATGNRTIYLPNANGSLALDSNIFYITGNQTISGVKTFINSGIFSNGAISAVPLLNNPLSIAGSGNNYLQLNIQNRATGTDASADLVITANNGTDNSNFINLGINNSGYSNASYTNGSGLDGYLFINGGSLDIGTQTPNTSIEFHAGGTTASKVIARITESGLNLVSGNLTVNNTGVLLNGQNSFTIFMQVTNSNPANDAISYFNNLPGGPSSVASNKMFQIGERCVARKASWNQYLDTFTGIPNQNATGYFINVSTQSTGVISTIINANTFGNSGFSYIGPITPNVTVNETDYVVCGLKWGNYTVGFRPSGWRAGVNIYCYN